MSYLCCHVTSLKHSASEREIVSSLRDDFALASGGQGLEFMYKLGDFVRVDANSEGGLLGSGHVVGVVIGAHRICSRGRAPFVLRNIMACVSRRQQCSIMESDSLSGTHQARKRLAGWSWL